MSMLARITILALFVAPAGCSGPCPDVPVELLSQRILPPPDLTPVCSAKPPAPVPCPEPVEDASILKGADAKPLSLDHAIALAQQNNPTLERMGEQIARAEGGQQVSFAEFLPESRVLYRHIEGAPSSEPFSLPTLPTNLVGNVAYGGASDSFDLAELHLQWTLCDFGRRAAHYGQANTALDIARLQYQRAKQGVAFQVATQYFAGLQARAALRVSEEAVRRAESYLNDTRNYQRRGTAIANDVFRADVLLAEMRLSQVKARTAEGVALAGLNQAIGINVSSATSIVDRPDAPPFEQTLADCLQLAVQNREEFRVALDTIRSARFGTRAAQADFMPKVLIGGVGAHEDGHNLRDADLVAGGVAIDLVLFEGGKRLGRLRIAEAEVRSAVAQGKEVCDRIAYEVHVAYLEIIDARERITLSETAREQATENLRVVLRLFERGDATPTDVVDGELALTRAQQNYYTALYDYETALARLAYAAGLPTLDILMGGRGGPCHEP
jgi:outer membrane protein TolC